MRRTVIAGNWKLFGTGTETRELLDGLVQGDSESDKADVIVCPPFTSLTLASELLKDSHIAVGGQDMSEHHSGAYTGEVSAAMLLTAGASYVILGHSERRQYHAETDRAVNAKARIALDLGLIPIICVGETIDEREAEQTEEVVGKQISGTTEGFSADDMSKTVIAYEPVWAIGTGKTATPEMAEDVHRFIRQKLPHSAETVPILYGGSVKPGNAAELLAQPDIDGALVGGASLKAEDFIAIVKAV